MTEEILIPYAVHSSGRIVHISEVESGLQCACTCAECGKDLIARKGEVNAHHFAHYSGGESLCSGESILHRIGKMLIADRIRASINTSEIKCAWKCMKCRQRHDGDLMKGVYSVEVEKRVGRSVGDVVMYDDIGEPIKVIEVVVTHPPTEESIDNYREMGVHMLEYHLGTFDQLAELLTGDEIHFAPNDMCRSPKCKKCDSIPVSRNMFYRWLRCTECDEFSKIPFVQVTSIFRDTSKPDPYNSKILFADQFTHDELKQAYRLRDSSMAYIRGISCGERGVFNYNETGYNCKSKDCNTTFVNLAFFTVTKDAYDTSRMEKWKHISSSMSCPSCDKEKENSKIEVFAKWLRYDHPKRDGVAA